MNLSWVIFLVIGFYCDESLMFKGIGLRDEYFLRLMILNRYFLYMHKWFSTIICFLVDEIIKLKVLACSFEITYKFWKTLSEALFKDPKATILTLGMFTGSRPWFPKIIPKATCDKLFLTHFPWRQRGVDTGEHRPIQKRKHFKKFVSNFKEANKKLIKLYREVNSFWKTLKPSVHTQKVLIKMFKFSKKYQSRDIVPLIYFSHEIMNFLGRPKIGLLYIQWL
jgi:hypothetical protein